MSTLVSTAVLASTRTQIADFLDALLMVYVLLIIAYILLSLVQTAGLRIPYNAVTGAIQTFLRDAVEPYLGLFRRFIPPLGPFDLSPIVGILVLEIVGRLVVNVVAG
ncbi:YggT family protein [Patulibacter defluvii]|uniref:YggT family protein n=1 Tax=Patulibacter defluvii TaxID=3095358 RepID=UPI002A749051|nr:YggT family protein [Patulibacter sp. DM4]